VVLGSDLATGVLTARNLLLVAAAALSCWRVVRAGSPGGEDPAPPERDDEKMHAPTGARG